MSDKKDKYINFETPKWFGIDFEKVNTVEDIKEILKLMDIRVYSNFQRYEDIKKYLKTK